MFELHATPFGLVFTFFENLPTLVPSTICGPVGSGIHLPLKTRRGSLPACSAICSAIYLFVNPCLGSYPSKDKHASESLQPARRLLREQVSLRRFSDVESAVQCLPNMTQMSIQGDVFSEPDMLAIAAVTRLRSLSLQSCRAKRDHMRRDNAANSIAPLGLMTWLQELEVQDVHGSSPQVPLCHRPCV